MRCVKTVITALLVTLICGISTYAQTSEQDIINRYLNKKKKIHTKKLGWISGSFSLDRINRDNDYNKFANYTSGQISNTSVSWLDEAVSFGFDMGMIFKKKYTFSISGEYWLTQGETQTGSFQYTPPDKASSNVENLTSEVKVWGVSAALQYYFYNCPSIENKIDRLSLRVGGSVGYYEAKWNLWPEYQNLNLATSTYTDENTTYKGTAPGFSFFMGADYPINFLNLVLGVDFGYLYLNFSNVSWYNETDEEIIVTYDNTEDSRVDLGLSGFRGKVELKKYFSW